MDRAWPIIVLVAVLCGILYFSVMYMAYLEDQIDYIEQNVGISQQVQTFQDTGAESGRSEVVAKGVGSTDIPEVVAKNDQIDEKVLAKITACADAYDIPITLLMALIEVESNFNPRAVNKHNGDGSRDYGLMQLNSDTFAEYSRDELLDVDNNLLLGCSYLRGLYDKYGNWYMAVYRYNGRGERAVEHLCKIMEAME